MPRQELREVSADSLCESFLMIGGGERRELCVQLGIVISQRGKRRPRAGWVLLRVTENRGAVGTGT